jgi:hypothetical protein
MAFYVIKPFLRRFFLWHFVREGDHEGSYSPGKRIKDRPIGCFANISPARPGRLEFLAQDLQAFFNPRPSCRLARRKIGDCCRGRFNPIA